MKIFLPVLLFTCQIAFSQANTDSARTGQGKEDSIALQKSSERLLVDSLPHLVFLTSNRGSLQNIIAQSKNLNVSAAPVSFVIQERKVHRKDVLFYALISILLLTALLKVFYSRYFNTIFRVYFNTSLRQNQLTDILVQEKLPSLIFNILFFITGSFYAWLIVNHYRGPHSKEGAVFIPVTFLYLSATYFGKLCVTKFLGWISGSPEAASSYIFIIFLINKIIGILLIPVIMLLAFCPAEWQHILILTSLFLVGILFLSRYIRSYDLLKQKLSIRGPHFLMYILAIEVLPMVIIIKGASRFLI